MKVLVSPTFSQTGFDEISKILSDFELEKPQDWESDPKCQALIIRSKDIVDEKFLSLFENLELIVSATSGFDHINYKDFPKLNFSYCPSANSQSAAELSLFHILSFLKKGPLITKAKDWRTHNMLSQELTSKKISLIGLGRIGSKVSKTLKALGCEEIYAFDPYVEKSHFDSLGVNRVGLTEAFKLADILSLHCPLTRKTRKMINETNLSEMNPQCLLVNCARGDLVDSNALLKFLNQKKLGGACLDVFDHEPLLKDSKLRNHPLIQWTPHIGAFTEQAQRKSAFEAAQQIKSWFKGDKDMLEFLPPATLWASDL